MNTTTKQTNHHKVKMIACSHCEHLVAETEEELMQLQRNVETEPCACISANCGHRLSAEMDDMPPCERCERCETCCLCTCETCGQQLHAMDECFDCLGA